MRCWLGEENGVRLGLHVSGVVCSRLGVWVWVERGCSRELTRRTRRMSFLRSSWLIYMCMHTQKSRRNEQIGENRYGQNKLQVQVTSPRKSIVGNGKGGGKPSGRVGSFGDVSSELTTRETRTGGRYPGNWGCDSVCQGASPRTLFCGNGD